MKNKGFTLAEVLITLGVIGVVAALSLPGLINDYRNKEIISQVKKANLILNEALQHATLNNGKVEDWDLSETKTLASYFKPNLRVKTDCGYVSGTENDCIGTSYVNLTGKNNVPAYFTQGNALLLDDGTAFVFYRADDGTAQDSGYIGVDVNGSLAPNKLGKDLFAFQIVDDTVRPYKYDVSGDSLKRGYCKTTRTGTGCAAYILKYGKMDYLD